MSWNPLPDGVSDEAWDAALTSLPDHTVFQSSAWAAHKRDAGWSVIRATAGSMEAPGAMVQALTKALPGGGALLWCRGGPAGDAALWDEGMRRALARAAGRPWTYIRICPYRTADAPTEAALAELGWSRPASPLDADTTFVLDLAGGPDALRRNLSANWSHNLRRAEKRGGPPRPWTDPDVAGMAAVYAALESFKGLPPQHSEASLTSLVARLGPRLLLHRADGPDGAPTALRAAVVQGDRAWDLLAAATPQARKSYATYSLLWSLLSACAARGVRRYDLGGADAARAKGVYDFKSGTGADFERFLGEWDWAGPAVLRRPVGAAIGLWKRGRP